MVSGSTERVQGERLVRRPAPRTMRKVSGERPVSCAATTSSAWEMRLKRLGVEVVAAVAAAMS